MNKDLQNRHINLMNDEKHYNTLSNYLKSLYNEKVFKISLNGSFSCPNRDGKISTKGCLFCSELGSGDFAGKKGDDLYTQFKQGLNMMSQKWKEGSYIAYFQANTNTYASIEELKEKYYSILDINKLYNNKIRILSIATRPDCIDEDIVSLLSTINKQIKVWVELGFQTSNELTATLMNRGYNNTTLDKAVKLLRDNNIEVIVHIINGLPNDNYDDYMNTINYLNKLDINGIKIHMLHVIDNAPLGDLYKSNPFPLLSRDEYVDVVINQLRLLKNDIIIHRITGDADKDHLIAPLWTLKKFVVIDEVDKKMRKEGYYQGDLYV